MLRPLSLLTLLLLSACESSPEPEDSCAGFEFPLAADGPRNHVATCTSSACGNGQNPPNSGPHCANPLPCRTYDAEQPRCGWIHNLEHGHVVFLYNCPDGCPDEVEKLKTAMQSVATGSNGVRRAVLAPDPALPQRVAALVWRRTYLADSADPQALQCLVQLQDDPQVTPEAGLACVP
ncbi:DUF3105 domain-containing protein [Myxococcaceae bacterium GXIMD 01537]